MYIYMEREREKEREIKECRFYLFRFLDYQKNYHEVMKYK